jgi:cytochrome c5
MLHMRLRAGLTGQETRDVLKFLRQSNTPTGRTNAPPVKKKSSVSMKATSKKANLENGKVIFEETCFACHGDDGKGALPGAPDFTKSGGVLFQSFSVLVDHVTNGFQTPGSPMAMPAKGGNEDMTSSDVNDVVKYIRQTFGKVNN